MSPPYIILVANNDQRIGKFDVSCLQLFRKVHREGFVETPGRARRSRKSIISNGAAHDTEASDSSPETRRKTGVTSKAHKEQMSDGDAKTNGQISKSAKSRKGTKDHRIDSNPHFEFGGSLGVSAMMVFFPL